MGKKSHQYYLYYLSLGIVFLGIGLLGVGMLAGVASTCKKICPLMYTDGTSCNVAQAVCLAGSAPGCKAQSTLYQSADASALQTANENQCFVCVDNDVRWPAYRSLGTIKWRPVESCTAESRDNFGGVESDGYTLCWNVPLEMTLREVTVTLLWIVLGAYVFQSIGCFVCAAGMKHFASKYSEDWKRLSKWEVRTGVLVKLFPKINRVVNFGVMFLVVFLFVAITVIGVCEDATNDFGDKVFFPAATLVSTLLLVVFTGVCIGATIFRRAVPFETPFYQPRMRPPEEKKLAFYCIEPFLNALALSGP